MTEPIEVTINGACRQLARGHTVAHLLAELDFNPQQVAVEVNQLIVPREQHADCQLASGDQVEVVTLVGGG